MPPFYVVQELYKNLGWVGHLTEIGIKTCPTFLHKHFDLIGRETKFFFIKNLIISTERNIFTAKILTMLMARLIT